MEVTIKGYILNHQQFYKCTRRTFCTHTKKLPFGMIRCLLIACSKKTYLEDNKKILALIFKCSHKWETRNCFDALTHLVCSPGFSHPALTSHQTLWDLANMPSLTEFLYAITDKAHHQLIEDVITTFTHDIIPRLDQFQTGTPFRPCN